MFWLVVGLVLATVVVVAVRPLVSGKESFGKPSSHDLDVFKDQLASVDADVARGVLTEDQAGPTRLEISRRILAADRRSREESEPGPAGRTANRIAVAILVVFLGMGSLGLYGLVGSPGLPDLPLSERIRVMNASRPGQLDAERTVRVPAIEPAEQEEELVRQLRDVVSSRPDDATGLRLLARHEARTGRLLEARQFQARVIDVLGAEAGAEDFNDLAVYMIGAAGGYISPEAEAVLSRALERDPENRRTRHLLAIALLQAGRKAQAIRTWQQLLSEAPVRPSAEEIRQILEAASDHPSARRITEAFEPDRTGTVINEDDQPANPESGNSTLRPEAGQGAGNGTPADRRPDSVPEPVRPGADVPDSGGIGK
ncbi:MAG: c-type cytochrome biogenesis protein CcmI [Rhodobacteraceae bacterium]|nr:c-type cytochrome biogenesis protein CcmI [Paracoccaceae bacterium]